MRSAFRIRLRWRRRWWFRVALCPRRWWEVIAPMLEVQMVELHAPEKRKSRGLAKLFGI